MLTTGSAPPALLQDLLRLSADPKKRVYAVLDGALFDDLSAELSVRAIAHRSLFIRVGDFEIVRSGLWLADPYAAFDPALHGMTGYAHQTLSTDSPGPSPIDTNASLPDPPAQISAILDIVGDVPAAVFWIGGGELTEPALWRHLRTINKVLVPRSEPPGTPPAQSHVAAETPAGAQPETHEAVLFRHADGNVLAQVMPILDAGQFVRLFGPAQAVQFHAPAWPSSSGSPVRRAALPDGAPPSKAGMLLLDKHQYDALQDKLVWKNRQHTMNYLRDAAPDETAQMSNDDLYAFVCRAEKSGFDTGLESDYAHGLWAYLLLCFGEGIARNQVITDGIRKAPDPDAAMEEIMAELAAMPGGEGASA